MNILYVSLGVHQKSMEGALRFMAQHSSGEFRMINWVAAGDCNARIIETLKDFKPDVTFMQLQSGGIITNDTLKSIPVVLTLKTPYRDGTTHLVMSPLEFMQRLAALAPRPRLRLIRFHGVLAPNARLRPEVIPGVPENPIPPQRTTPRRPLPRRLLA